MSVSRDLGHVPFVIVTISSIPRYLTRATRRKPAVEQDMISISDLKAPEIILAVFGWVPIAQALILCEMFCKPLFVLLNFFFWPLYCLFFDIQILITPLVSSNSSWNYYYCQYWMQNIQD